MSFRSFKCFILLDNKLKFLLYCAFLLHNKHFFVLIANFLEFELVILNRLFQLKGKQGKNYLQSK